MIILNEKVIMAIEKYQNTKNISLTEISTEYSIDRHTLSKYKDENLNEWVKYENKYYKLDDKEKMAINDYVDNNLNFSDIKRIYGYKNESFKKKLDVMNLDYNSKYIKQFNRDFFNVVDDEFKAYILGFILADGYINEDKNFVRIKISQKDVDILIKICNAINLDTEEIKTEIHRDTHNLHSYITLYGKDIVSKLKEYNLYQKKSCNEKPLLNLPNDLTRHYIRGIFDGDGWVTSDFKILGFCGSYETLCMIKNNIEKNVSLRFNANGSPKIIFDSNIYKLRYYGINIRNILNYLYNDANIYLNRKHELKKNELSKRRLK